MHIIYQQQVSELGFEPHFLGEGCWYYTNEHASLYSVNTDYYKNITVSTTQWSISRTNLVIKVVHHKSDGWHSGNIINYDACSNPTGRKLIVSRMHSKPCW